MTVVEQSLNNVYNCDELSYKHVTHCHIPGDRAKYCVTKTYIKILNKTKKVVERGEG